MLMQAMSFAASGRACPPLTSSVQRQVLMLADRGIRAAALGHGSGQAGLLVKDLAGLIALRVVSRGMQLLDAVGSAAKRGEACWQPLPHLYLGWSGAPTCTHASMLSISTAFLLVCLQQGASSDSRTGASRWCAAQDLNLDLN